MISKTNKETTVSLFCSGQERPMTENELKAQAEKLKELTHKIQAYLESARRSVMSQFPRIDRNIVEIK